MKLLPCSLVALLAAALFSSAQPAGSPENRGAGFDSLGRFAVEASIPAGTRHAFIEISETLGPGATWRKMIACTTDGRAGRVTFRLPPQGSARCFARVVTGDAVTPPPVELADPELVDIDYGPLVSEQAKVALLVNAGAKMREWKHLPRSQSQANLVAWALAQPDVAHAAVSPVADNVSIRFADGDVCALINRPRTAADANNPMPSALGIPKLEPSDEPGALTTLINRVGGIPGNNRAVTAFSLESTFANSGPTICAWLNDKGYAATNYHSTTLSQIMAWSSPGDRLGVLFWHAHGCSYLRSDNTEGIGIITREFADPHASHPVYTEMRKSGELMLAKDDSEELPYLGITSKFIRNRMHFAPHSIVMLDACFGGHADLGNAFLAAGAGSFASWDWLSGDSSGTPCLKVFDRLLGANEEPPISTPKERPFSLNVIRWWMSLNGYDVDPSPMFKDQNRPNAKLVWHHHHQSPAHILLPSVMRVLAEAGSPGEAFSKYLIEGDFGADPGAANRSVVWGGQPMQVVRWDEDEGIVIRIPAVPPKGEIQVILRKDFYAHSNKVPISEWTVPFTYTVTGEGSLAATMSLNVKFRGDIHGSRGMPEMPVEHLPVVFGNVEDCTGQISAAGSHRSSESTTISWSGGSKLRSHDPNAGGTGVVTDLVWCNGILQIPQGKALFFHLGAHGSFTSTTRVVNSNGGVHEYVEEETMALDSFPFLFTQPLSFNAATGRLDGGTRSLPLDPGTATLTWPAVTPAFAPAETTPR